MITLREVKEEIRIITSTDTTDMKKGKVTAMNKRLQFLNSMQLYLEKNPSEKFVKAELERMKKRLLLLNKGFVCDAGKMDKEAKKVYDKSVNISGIRTQIKTLNYLLKN
jgi:hypothetical protein